MNHPIAIGLLAFANLFTLIGLAMAAAALRRRLAWVRVAGVVVGFEYSNRADRPVVEYRAGGDPPRRVRSNGNERVPIGASMTVAYDPRRPERAIVETAMTSWGAPALLVALGVGMSAGVVALLRALR